MNETEMDIDIMKIRTPFMKKILEKIIIKLIKNKLKTNMDISLKKIEIQSETMPDNKLVYDIFLSTKIRIKEDELEKILLNYYDF